MRFFQGGLNHAEVTGPHEHLASITDECEVCVEFLRALAAQHRVRDQLDRHEA